MRTKTTMIALAALLALAAPLPAQAEADECSETLCMRDGSGEAVGTWAEGKTLNRKARAKEAKKQRKRKDVQVRVELEGGRASAFIDGRYLATGGEGLPLKPGMHELEVRDGERVIALGVITIPSKGVDEVVIVVPVD